MDVKKRCIQDRNDEKILEDSVAGSHGGIVSICHVLAWFRGPGPRESWCWNWQVVGWEFVHVLTHIFLPFSLSWNAKNVGEKGGEIATPKVSRRGKTPAKVCAREAWIIPETGCVAQDPAGEKK